MPWCPHRFPATERKEVTREFTKYERHGQPHRSCPRKGGAHPHAPFGVSNSLGAWGFPQRPGPPGFTGRQVCRGRPSTEAPGLVSGRTLPAFTSLHRPGEAFPSVWPWRPPGPLAAWLKQVHTAVQPGPLGSPESGLQRPCSGARPSLLLPLCHSGNRLPLPACLTRSLPFLPARPSRPQQRPAGCLPSVPAQSPRPAYPQRRAAFPTVPCGCPRSQCPGTAL